MARKPLYVHRRIDELLYLRLAVVGRLEVGHMFKRSLDILYLRRRHRGDQLRYRVHLDDWDIQRAADVFNRAAALHPSEGYDLRDVVRAVLFDNIGDQLFTSLVGDVGIDIGHAYAFRVEKTLKEQIVPYRVEVGYPQ